MEISLKTDYCGNMIYEDGSLSRVMVEGGYITFNGTTPLYQYYLQDLLGDNRVVMNQNGTMEQINHYYLFGGLMGDSNNKMTNQDYPSDYKALSTQPYKYNGKELDRMHGLDWYDYGARHYDAVLGRWICMDPKAEKYYSVSPYAYCEDNPIRYIDPDGREWKDTQDEEIAKRLQQNIANRDNSLAKQEQKINAKIEQIGNNTKLSAEKRDQQIAKQQGKLENVQTQRTILSNFNEGITQLGNSSTVYTFNTVEQGTTATLSSTSDGTVIINNYGTTGNRAHETNHAIQYDNGKVSFEKFGSNIVSFHADYRGLEIQSYGVEYSITGGTVPTSDARDPRTVFGINLQWLYGLKDPNTGGYPYKPENYR